MDRLIRTVLAIVVGVVAAMGVPREVGRELRWEVAWEHTLGSADGSSRGSSTISDPSAHVPLESSRRFSLIHAADGEPRATGLKTEVFQASPQALINQADDVPRWAVQSWDGDILQVVPRRGIPRLRGDTLLQFDNESKVYGDVVTSGEQWVVDLPQNATVYDVAVDATGTHWFAVGSIDGRVLITDGVGGREWVYSTDSSGDAGFTPTVYGIHIARVDQPTSEPGDAPAVYIIQGTSPQTVRRIELLEGGETTAAVIGEIADAHVGKRPQTILGVRSDLLVAGARGGLFVADLGADRSLTVPVAGLSGLSGVGQSRDRLVMVAATGYEGPLIIVGASDFSAIASWELDDPSLRVQVAGGGPVGDRLLVQDNDHVVGLEISL